MKDNPYICTYSSVLLLICVSLVHNKHDGCRDPAHVAENEVAYRRLRSMCDHTRAQAHIRQGALFEGQSLYMYILLSSVTNLCFTCSQQT